METIKELRAICQPAQPGGSLRFLNDGPYRFFSIYVTRFILQKQIPCEKMALVLAAAGVGACFLLLSGSLWLILTGALMLGLGSILRCAACEVRTCRRGSGKSAAGEKSDFGLTGIYFDTLLQYTLHLLMPLCLSFGIFKNSAESGWLLAGITAALMQILLLVMHHAQESALLRKINHERGAHVLRQASEQPAGASSLAQKLITALNQALLYPALGSGLLIFSAAAFFTGSTAFLKLFLLLTAGGSAFAALYTIARKLKNSDPDKQFAHLFQPK